MFNKIHKIARNRGLNIFISADGGQLHISLIPKSLSEKIIPVSLSCTVETAEQALNNALDEMLNMEMDILQVEAFKKSLTEKSKPKVDLKKAKNEPDMFSAKPEDKTSEIEDVDPSDEIEPEEEALDIEEASKEATDEEDST